MKIQTEPIIMVKMGTSRQVVIPKKITDKRNLKAGDYFAVEDQGPSILLTPKSIVDKKFHETVMEHLRISQAQYKAGKFHGPYDDVDAMIKDMQKRAEKRKNKA